MALLPADQLGVHIDSTHIHFGILLPGVSVSSGCSVDVLIIHGADQFLQGVAATRFALAPGQLDPWGDHWSASVPLADPLFARPGQYVYRYKVTRTLPEGSVFTRDFLSDPFAREYGVGKLSSFSLGYQPYVWSTGESSWRTPAEADLVLYELNLAEFAADLPKAIERLPYLADLGVNGISLMPVTNVQETVDWGYLPMGYWGVDERFGQRRDFQAFVDAAHQLGIAVLVDAIYGHTSEDFLYEELYRDLRLPNPFMGRFAQDLFGVSTDWNQDLVRAFFLSVNRHWLEVFHVDGFRFDCVPNYWDGPTGKGYASLAYDTYQLVKERLAAGDAAYARFQRGDGRLNLIQCAEQLEDVEGVLRGTYSTSTWQNRTLGAARQAAVGAPGALTALGLALAADGLPTEVTHNGTDVIAKAPLQYIETHDHARFICQYGLSHGDGSALLREGDRNQWFKVQPYLIGTLLARGVPLLWQGQELMENYWLPEQGRARVALLRPMRWQYFYGDIGKATLRLVRQLLKLRQERSELRRGEVYFFNDPGRYQNRGLLLFARWQGTAYTLVALNMSGEQQWAPFWFPIAGSYQEQLHGAQEPQLNLSGVGALQETWLAIPPNYGRVWSSV
ncbi:MAG: alpha-amylase family glycosyl hydrolase [Cyanobacteriota bacterium]|nr:alpha-amylase family glycosyl hydrolase [Cyanobacteriota bacterium]